MKKIFLIMSVAILMVTNADARRWYVDCLDGTTNAAATSWASAENDLQAVINTRSSTGDEIWVRGFTKDQISNNPGLVYRPAQFTTDPQQHYPQYYPNDILCSQDFDAKRKTLKIYGGFRGNEIILADRKHWKEYRSMLGTAKDALNPGCLININQSNNIILDGFVIENNTTTHGMIWVGGTGTQILSNLIIRNNRSEREGIIASESGSSCMTKLFNVEMAFNTFTSNSALIHNYRSSMELYNVTIACNNHRELGIPAFSVKSANLRIYNSIIWMNGGYNYTGGNASLTNCLTEVAYKNALPAAVVKTNLITASDAGFVRVNLRTQALSDFRLLETSPAIDAGDSDLYDYAYYSYTSPSFTSSITDFLERDLDGLTRWDINGGEIDLGAYEFGGIVFRSPQMTEEDKETEMTAVKKEILLYPTSVNKQGNIYLENAEGNGILRVYSSSGACISTQSIADGNAIITAPNNAGIYIVLVTGQNGEVLYNDKIVVIP